MQKMFDSSQLLAIEKSLRESLEDIRQSSNTNGATQPKKKTMGTKQEVSASTVVVPASIPIPTSVPAQETAKSEPHNNNVVSMSDRKPKKRDSLSDDELLKIVNKPYKSLERFSKLAAERRIRLLLVYGSPGMGKTHTVLEAMEAMKRADEKFEFFSLSGIISPVLLYVRMYETREGVLILDDCDSAFEDPASLKMLSSATTSRQQRRVGYIKLSQELIKNDIPSEFDFNGCIVIITNKDLNDGSSKNPLKYWALLSRSVEICTNLKSKREKILRIKYVLDTTNVLRDVVDNQYHEEVIDFFLENHEHFKELSIRTLVKVAEFRSYFPERDIWEEEVISRLFVE